MSDHEFTFKLEIKAKTLKAALYAIILISLFVALPTLAYVLYLFYGH
jgi:hypothetical protein